MFFSSDLIAIKMIFHKTSKNTSKNRVDHIIKYCTRRMPSYIKAFITRFYQHIDYMKQQKIRTSFELFMLERSNKSAPNFMEMVPFLYHKSLTIELKDAFVDLNDIYLNSIQKRIAFSI